MLLYWIDIVHTTSNILYTKQAISGDLVFSTRSRIVKILFFAVTGLIIVSTLVLAICGTIYYMGLPELDLFYVINMFLICILHFVYMVGIAVYGTILFYRLYKNGKSSFSFIIRIEVFSLTIVICFVARIVAFILYSVNYDKVNMTLIFVFGNFIPEVIPTILCIWLFNSNFVQHKYFQDNTYQRLLN